MNTLKQFQIILIIILISFSKVFSQSSNQKIKVINMEGVEGTLYLGWYDKAADFPINDKAIYREEIKVANQTEITINFKDIPSGKYAIAVFLDENDDYILNKNFFGIPKEKYGFSNNVLPWLRPATFEESSINITEERSPVIIKLK